MAYRLEREKTNCIELEVGDELLKIPTGGMALYKKILEAQGKLRDIQTKIERMTANSNPITEELVNYLGETVLYLFNTAFGEANAEKIVNFYEGNYDEMLLKVYPFLLNVFIPAVKEKAKAESQAYAKRISGAS
jgi:hypothetical protein